MNKGREGKTLEDGLCEAGAHLLGCALPQPCKAEVSGAVLDTFTKYSPNRAKQSK